MKLAFDNDNCTDQYDHCMKKDERMKKIEENFAFLINYEIFDNYSSHPYLSQIYPISNIKKIVLVQ